MRVSLLVAAVIAGGASIAGAQAPNPGECNAASAAVSGRALPALDDSTFIWWYTLAGCGPIGERAAAQALRSNALQRENSADRLREFFLLFYARRTPELFAALKDGVASAGASVAYKREAIAALGALHYPGFDFDSGGLEILASTDCGSTRRVLVGSGSTSDLPAGYLGQMVSVLDDQQHRSSNAPVVRALAYCWRKLLVRDLPIDPKKLKLKHVCEDRFLVTNDNLADATVSVDVEGTSEQFRLKVFAEREILFETLNSGKVRLYFGGVLVDKKQAAANRCDRK